MVVKGHYDEERNIPREIATYGAVLGFFSTFGGVVIKELDFPTISNVLYGLGALGYLTCLGIFAFSTRAHENRRNDDKNLESAVKTDLGGK